MAWVFYFFSKVLPARTVGRLTMVGTGPATIGKEVRFLDSFIMISMLTGQKLLPLIDASELPKQYGGQAADITA